MHYLDLGLNSVKSTYNYDYGTHESESAVTDKAAVNPFASSRTLASEPLTRKSHELLRTLIENANRRTVYSFYSNQSDLARKLNVTRQALSVHFKKLREHGLVQVGRGFVDVTEEGSKAAGYNTNPVIVMVRLSPHKRFEACKKISELHALDIFRVTGDIDVVLVVEQRELVEVVGKLESLDGVLETKSLVSIEKMK